jgi:16S rRNA (guanine966-N2)-methyltransferase
LAQAALGSALAGGWLLPGALIVIEETTKARFVVPAEFTELERRTYDDTEFVFLRSN